MQSVEHLEEALDAIFALRKLSCSFINAAAAAALDAFVLAQIVVVSKKLRVLYGLRLFCAALR